MNQSWPQVQVALDLVNLREALKIARESSSAGVGWLEAGTPLIKSEGIQSVRALSKAFPKCVVVADMKTLDAGKIESNMAFHAGADVVSISGLAHDSTVRESVRTAAKIDRMVMADLLMSANPRKRALELEKLGVSIVCLHTGIDIQKSLHSRLKVSKVVQDISRSLKVPVAAAGGVTPDAVPGLVRAGVKVIIVGGYITGSKNPAHASRRILQKIRETAPLRTE